MQKSYNFQQKVIFHETRGIKNVIDKTSFKTNVINIAV